MTDVLTPTIRLTEPTPGGDSGTWPTLLNSDLVYIDEAINQSVTVPIADVNVVLVADGSSGDQARYLRYNFTGALTANRTVTLPANVKVGWASNNTTGGHNVILSAGGITISLPDSSWTFFNCSGTDISTQVVRFGAVNVTGNAAVGGTLGVTGNTTLSGTLGVTGNTTLSGYLIVNGTQTVSGITGWELSGSGGLNTITGQTRNIGVDARASGILASVFDALSDVRVKSEIEAITPEQGAAFVQTVSPKRYRKDGAIESGFIAQDMIRAGYSHMVNTVPHEGLPELIEGDLTSKKDTVLSLSYDQTIAYLAAALKGALIRIEALEARP